MPTQITQSDHDDPRRTVLRVEGEMQRDDAVLLEKLVAEIRQSSGNLVIVDLADLDLLDSESASILRLLADRHDVEIEGVEIFLQSAIDMAERA